MASLGYLMRKIYSVHSIKCDLSVFSARVNIVGGLSGRVSNSSTLEKQERAGTAASVAIELTSFSGGVTRIQ